MFNAALIRKYPEAFDSGLALRGLAPMAELVIEKYVARLDQFKQLQDAKKRLSDASKEIAPAKASGKDAYAQQTIDEMAELKAFVRSGDETNMRLCRESLRLLLSIPNIPLSDVPEGKDESANIEHHTFGEKPEMDFEPRQYFKLGEALGLLSREQYAKIWNSRIEVVKGPLARMERAIGVFILDIHTSENGYLEITPPALVHDDIRGNGQSPRVHFECEKYQIQMERFKGAVEIEKAEQHVLELRKGSGDGTVEQPGTTDKERAKFDDIPDNTVKQISPNDKERIRIASKFRSKTFSLPQTSHLSPINLVRQRRFREAELPQRYTCFTPYFDTGPINGRTQAIIGMMRRYQHSNVEVTSITTPDNSQSEFDHMLEADEKILQRLGLHYRVVTCATGDLDFFSQKTVDIEVWLPGQGVYRKVSSCSAYGDFEARRLGIGYFNVGEDKSDIVHTLHGSGLSVGRTMAAILETFQREDGSIGIPEALRPYMGGLEALEREIV